MSENELKKKIKRNRIIIVLLLLITIIGIGYASLSANIQINGTTKISNANWNVRFKANSINVTEGSVSDEKVTKAATIDSLTEVSYNVTLAVPGDFYEFTVVAENTGSIDAMIDSVVSKLGDTSITANTLPSYLKYSVTYADGVEIGPNHLLAANSEETIKVRLEYDKEVEENELPTTNQSLSLNFQIFYVQADENAVAVNH